MMVSWRRSEVERIDVVAAVPPCVVDAATRVPHLPQKLYSAPTG